MIKYYMDIFADDFILSNPEDFELYVLEHVLDSEIEVDSIEYTDMVYIVKCTNGVVLYYDVDEYEDLDNEIDCLNNEYDRSR